MNNKVSWNLKDFLSFPMNDGFTYFDAHTCTACQIGALFLSSVGIKPEQLCDINTLPFGSNIYNQLHKFLNAIKVVSPALAVAADMAEKIHFVKGKPQMAKLFLANAIEKLNLAEDLSKIGDLEDWKIKIIPKNFHRARCPQHIYDALDAMKEEFESYNFDEYHNYTSTKGKVSA